MYLCTLCASMHGPGPCPGFERKPKPLEKLIGDLEELAARFGNQGDRFQANGHFAEATEQFGRQFGVERALAKVREHLT